MGKTKDAGAKESVAVVAPPERPQDVLTIERKDGESRDAAIVRTAANPVARGAITACKATEYLLADADVSAYVQKLREQTEAVAGGDLSGVETMLATQALALDALFNHMSMRALETSGWQAKEAVLRLALKAQAQCASTAKVLGELKNPRSVAFIRQQNNANGPQQVNNGVGTPAEGSRARARKNPERSNELLEESDGEWMDTGTAGQAVRGNQALAAVGAVNRP
ncbi:Phasin domain-containing protein [Cupriavidus necator]|uniref:hypothetical protein n=1 Tax=Cupriavidus necator TaxID=106590 RepID=UPI003F7377BB